MNYELQNKLEEQNHEEENEATVLVRTEGAADIRDIDFQDSTDVTSFWK